MFIHIFRYRLKCLLRDRETIFWTMLFPLILATFFNMAFSNLNSDEVFKAIDIAVVSNSEYQNNPSFKLAIEEASKGNDRLFNLSEVSLANAEQLLNDRKIDCYIIADSPIKLVSVSSGLNQSIVKSFIDSYSQTASAVLNIAKENPSSLQSAYKEIASRKQYLKEVSGTAAPPDNTLIYFYSLIAMACLYGSFLGNREVADIQANLSPLAARVNIAPVHKLKTFFYSMSASLVISFTELIVLLIYLHYGLKIDFGSRTGLVILTTFIGCVTGVTYGSFISSIVTKGLGFKVAILILSTMAGCVLSGMMYQNIKYMIQRRVPLLSLINPVNLLTDAFYSLYYYDSLKRYAINIGMLSIFVIFFSVGTYLMIRRRKYASL